MQKYLKYSIFLLIIVFAVISIIAFSTGAVEVMLEVNPFFFLIAAAFFVVSIVFWIVPWALIIKKKRTFSFPEAIVLGFSCVYGALTPLQVGSEALRAIKAKDHFGVPYSESISAAMIVKGMKFFFLALMASIVVGVILLQTHLSPIMFIGILSGFAVILFAALLFLLPLNKEIGLRIAGFFKELAKWFGEFSILEKYFHNYSHYLEKESRRILLIVLLLSALSFSFEFLALFFCFVSLNVFIDLLPLAVLFVIVSVLERTPFLPRGLGLVEAAGFIFLSIPEFSMVSLTTSQIGAILVVFDFARLVIPTFVSFAFSCVKIKRKK